MNWFSCTRRCAVALVWITSCILALPVLWTNVSPLFSSGFNCPQRVDVERKKFLVLNFIRTQTSFLCTIFYLMVKQQKIENVKSDICLIFKVIFAWSLKCKISCFCCGAGWAPVTNILFFRFQNNWLEWWLSGRESRVVNNGKTHLLTLRFSTSTVDFDDFAGKMKKLVFCIRRQHVHMRGCLISSHRWVLSLLINISFSCFQKVPSGN